LEESKILRKTSAERSLTRYFKRERGRFKCGKSKRGGTIGGRGGSSKREKTKAFKRRKPTGLGGVKQLNPESGPKKNYKDIENCKTAGE